MPKPMILQFLQKILESNQRMRRKFRLHTCINLTKYFKDGTRSKKRECDEALKKRIGHEKTTFSKLMKIVPHKNMTYTSSATLYMVFCIVRCCNMAS